MTNGASQSFKKRILEECKKLTDEGKHIEASHLFRTYFPDFNSPLPERLDNFYV